MIMNLRDLLASAGRGRAVPAFNVYNLETCMAVAQAAADTKRPIILALGERYLAQSPISIMGPLMRSVVLFFGIDAAIHLDHAQKPESFYQAADSGFTSAMYDGSMLPFEQNVEHTREMAEFLHARGLSIEAELGMMNAEDGTHDGTDLELTSPEMAQAFCQRTQIDALAVAIGNAHGLYKATPNLDLPRISRIYEATELPLVLHGGSGIPADQIQKAVERGIRKMNINTELALAGAASAGQCWMEHGSTLRLEKMMISVQKAMYEKAVESILLLDATKSS